MSRIVGWCLKNKSVVFLATLLLIGSGVFAATRLNQELLPDISFPIVAITTPVQGAGPEVVDEQVTQTIEAAANGVGGIESIQSTSSQGFSFVLVEFGLDTDTEQAEEDLKAAVGGVQLPQGAGEPEVEAQSASAFPILTYSLSAEDGDLASLTTYAQDELVPALEDIEGVSGVELVGGAEDRIEVEMDPEKLQDENLPAAAVAGAVSGAAVDSPVGRVPLDDRQTPVRATSEINGVEALRDLPVGTSGGAAAATAAPTGAAAAAGGAPSGAPGGAPQGGAPQGGAPQGAPPTGGAASGAPAGAPVQAAAPQGAPAEAAEEPPEPVVLRDVAEVREVPADISGISRTNGEPSLGLNITKETDANTIEVAEGVQEALRENRGELRSEQVTTIVNSAEDVEESVSGLVQEGLIGAALAIVVIFAFLRSLRATLVTAVSLPTSVLAALLFSWQQDLTLNILTLAGLTIAVGRVVDDAIVVLENSYRYIQQGYDPEEAALKGTSEVASAITSSTLSTAAVFLPLAIVGGIISKFFVPLSLTVALALFASLIVSVTIIPVLVSLFLGRRKNREDRIPPEQRSNGNVDNESRLRRVGGGHRIGGPARVLIGILVFLLASAAVLVIASLAGVLGEVPGLLTGFVTAVDGIVASLSIAAIVALGLGAVLLVALVIALARAAARRPSGASEARDEDDGLLVRLYTPALRWSLRHRLAVLALALVAFVGGLGIVTLLDQTFFPAGDERLLQAQVELEAGTGLEETDREVRDLEDFLEDDAAVESYQVSAGGENSFSPDSPIQPENQAQAFITAREDADVRALLDRVSNEGEELYGEGFQASVVANGPPTGGLEAVLTGGTNEELEEAAELVQEEFSGLEDVNNVRTDSSGGTPEVVVEVNAEEAAAKGISPGDVSSSLGLLVGEAALTTINETPVIVTVPEGAKDTIGEVRELPLGPGVVVDDVADVREVESPAAISRSDGDRAVTVSANILSENTQAVSTAATAAIDTLDLPGEVEARVGGETEDIDESFRNLFLSIFVALALVYLILVVFFGSLLVPLVILLAVPLTTIGAFGALYLTDTALSLPSLLGLLLLIGIVVSNAILFVDFATKAIERHETADDAIIEAGRSRLRPILMTALATIFALTPLALGLSGSGGLISSSLAIAVIGGLATSTFLTLLVVPVGFSLLKRGRKKKGGFAAS